jgi:hypothetical protein
MWVLRDLSNGDGADGRPFPRYVWAFRTRKQAREKQLEHRDNAELSRLGPVENWSAATLLLLYDWVTANYFRRCKEARFADIRISL